MRNTIVETAMRVDDIVYHPGSGTSAGYQLDVVAIESPVVPEVLQDTDEVRGTSVKPWKFIEEDDLRAFPAYFL